MSVLAVLALIPRSVHSPSSTSFPHRRWRASSAVSITTYGSTTPRPPLCIVSGEPEDHLLTLVPEYSRRMSASISRQRQAHLGRVCKLTGAVILPRQLLARDGSRCYAGPRTA